MEAYSWLRFKHAVATHRTTIVAACIVVALFSTTMLATGFVTDASALSPLAEDDETSFHAASLEQHATVRVHEDTDAYDRGERLRDASLYPRFNASDPTLRATATVDQATLQNVTVTLTYTASRTGADGDRFYEETVVLASVDEPTRSAANVTAAFPVDEAFAQQARLEEEFGAGVSVSMSVATTATYSYVTPTGESVTRSLESSGPVERVGQLYAFPSGTDRATHRPGTETADGDALSRFLNWLALVALLCSAAFGVAAVASDRYIDAAAVAEEIQWQRFRDWVTEVESYTPQGDVNTVEVTTLADLVNLAIDTNRRVLYHRPVQEYIVVEDDVMYKYTPETGADAGSTELFGLRKEDLADTEFPNFDVFGSNDPRDGPGGSGGRR